MRRQAWQEVTAAMMAVGLEAERVKKEAARPQALPARSDCQKHFERCQDSYLGRRNGGGWGNTICFDCWDLCKKNKSWPELTGARKPCHWWDWLDAAPPGGEPRRSRP